MTLAENTMTAARPDPRLPESWCREGVAHDHQACGTLWDSTDYRHVEEAARWADDHPTVTSPVLLVEWLNDDYVRISLDGKTIMNVNSDDHGDDGMEAAITAAGRTALLLGARVETVGTPNLDIKL